MRKMNAHLQEMEISEGKAVRIITGFGECCIDPEATKETVGELIRKTPEFLKVQNQRMKIVAQQNIAEQSRFEAIKSSYAKDVKNEKLHTAACQAALGAAATLESELCFMTADYSALWDKLYMENPEYLPCGPGQHCLEDGEYEDLKAKYGALEEHERLTEAGEAIPDWRGTEYWLKTAGKWAMYKIEHIGETPPENFVLPDKLTDEQRREIAAQQEAERIAAMSAEDRAKAKQAALDALADEADRLDRRARIQRTKFDPAAWYDEHAAEIEAKYA